MQPQVHRSHQIKTLLLQCMEGKSIRLFFCYWSTGVHWTGLLLYADNRSLPLSWKIEANGPEIHYANSQGREEEEL